MDNSHTGFRFLTIRDRFEGGDSGLSNFSIFDSKNVSLFEKMAKNLIISSA